MKLVDWRLMNKEKLIPELRFPEFENEGEWDEKQLGDALIQNPEYGINAPAVPFSNKLPTYLRITDISEDGRFLSDEKVSVDREVAENNYLSDGDIVLARTGASVGKSYKYRNEDGRLVFAGFLIRLKPDSKKLNSDFLFQFLATNQYWKWVSFISARSGQPGINATEYSSLPVYLPKPAEQQKIATCLSSLDEIIAAHSQKLELLTDHKKGLMQNLFPQEGEKAPKLRFKEFEGDGEWVEKDLYDLGELINGLTYSPEDVREKGLLVLRSSNIQNGLIDLNDCVFVKTDIKGANLSRPNDILVCVRNGSKALIGKNAIIPKGLPLATHGAFMTVFRAKNSEFVFQLFQTKFYDKQVKADLGATINSINGKNFIKYKFPVPLNPKEQQKIASCLSSLDALIASQTEKIEQLKLHKKGLMQGLFPKIND